MATQSIMIGNKDGKNRLEPKQAQGSECQVKKR